MKMNELTQLDRLLKHVDPNYADDFCQTWYIDLDQYKEHPDTLLLMANAVLNHWDIPLYTTGVSWHEKDECFVWHFGKNTSPEYNNYKQQEN